MVDRIAKLIATKIVLANETDEDREIYEYGLQIILNTLFSISIVLLLGFLMNEMQGTIVFLICYCSLRLFAGGLHADTNNKCMTIFICGYLVFAIIIKNIEVTLNFSSIAVLLGSIICIVLWAPVDVPNNPIPISKKEL